MKVRLLVAIGVVVLVCAAAWRAAAQQSAAVPAAVLPASNVVPNLINYSGVLKDASGRTLTSLTGVTFLLYQEEQGGSPLWLETQNVTPDKTGHYTVQLGATRASGMPADLFVSGAARWLALQIAGEAEQARVLLVAVPYAMKAGDAETIHGLPASAFVLAAPPTAAAAAPVTSDSTASSATSVSPATTSNVTTTGGTANTIPMFTTATNVQNSILTQTSTTAINVGGKLNLPATSTATASAGYNSRPQDFVASVFNSSTSTAVPQTFQWQAEPLNNDKTTATGTLNLLYATGTATPAETGLKISNKGLFTFATGQTFPGTIAGVTTASGSGLKGGGTSGTLNLGLVTTCTSGQLLKWSGSAWACAADLNSGGTVTSVGLSAPATDFTVSGSPVTGTGTLNFAWNVAPSNADTANAIVKRDSSGNFSASAITAASLGASGTVSAAVLSAPNATITDATLDFLEIPDTGLGYPLEAYSSYSGATTIFGEASSSTGPAWGVEGYTASSASNAYGVIGDASASSGSPIGVYGETPYSTLGIGVFGQNGSESSTVATVAAYGHGVGVWGDGGTTSRQLGVVGTAGDGWAGAFENDSSSNYDTLDIIANGSGSKPLYAENTANNTYCDVDASGNLNCSGSKNAVVPVDGGKRIVAMSAIESPKNWFEDFGSAQLVNGAAVVPLDPTFIQTVNSEQEYQVFLTPYGDCKGLYVGNRTAASFEVHELGGGSASLSFGYRITALRRNYENVRFADHTHDLDSVKAMRERMRNASAQPHTHDPGKKLMPAPARTATLKPAAAVAKPK
jgi:hypothetical protein